MAYDDPCIYHALQIKRYDGLSREETAIRLVYALANKLKLAQDELIKHMKLCMRPTVWVEESGAISEEVWKKL